jgi:hypothetical protein
MLDAKDTFYITLRDRIAVVNPDRRMLTRGALRPSVLVEEAEPVASKPVQDVFLIRWKGIRRERSLAQTLVLMDCEIHYSTAGSASACGLDRGRALAEMDEELMQMLVPPGTPTMNYATSPCSATGTSVFWTEPEMGAATTVRDALQRVVKLTVIAREAGGIQ